MQTTLLDADETARQSQLLDEIERRVGPAVHIRLDDATPEVIAAHRKLIEKVNSAANP